MYRTMKALKELIYTSNRVLSPLMCGTCGSERITDNLVCQDCGYGMSHQKPGLILYPLVVDNNNKHIILKPAK